MREALKPGPDYLKGYPHQVGPADFRLMHKAIQSMRLCEKAAEAQPYTAILFEWQVTPPSFSGSSPLEYPHQHICSRWRCIHSHLVSSSQRV